MIHTTEKIEKVAVRIKCGQNGSHVLDCGIRINQAVTDRNRIILMLKTLHRHNNTQSNERNLQDTANSGEVEERTKQLKDSERLAAIGATAGMVGHDIRNPLQAITGDLYLAKTEFAAIPESAEKQECIESLSGNRKEHRLHQQDRG